MKFEVLYDPYERRDEKREKTYKFECKDEVDAKLKMCSLFFGYNNVEQLFREFDCKDGDSKEGLLAYVLDHVDRYNGDDKLDYFVHMSNDKGDYLWKATKPKAEEINS